MNIQFSLSTNTTNESATIVPVDTASVMNQQPVESSVNEVSSADELKTLQIQGVSVPVGQEQFIRTIERAVKALQGPDTVLDISIHDKTHQLLVKVLNKDTGELIREVPPEKTLDLVANMMELAGIMIDTKV